MSQNKPISWSYYTTDDKQEQSSMCAEWTRPLLERFSFLSQEPVAALFGSPVRFPMSDLRTDDLMILRMTVIVVDEKHVIQVFC